MDFKNKSNADILMQMKKYENEYESIKDKVNHLLDSLHELDKKYNTAKNELIKRGYRF